MTKKGSKNKTSAAKPKKAKQMPIPGTERKTNKKIDEAASAYVSERDERMALTKAEKKKHDELLAVMKAEGISDYVYEDDDGTELRVKLTAAEKVSVKTVKPEDAPAESDGE